MVAVTGGAIASVVGVLTAVSILVGLMWSPPGRWLFRLMVKTPATEWLHDGLRPVADKVNWLEQEFRPNGGGSLRDKVDSMVTTLNDNASSNVQIRAVVDRMDSRLIRVEGVVDKVTMRQVLLMDVADAATMESNQERQTTFVSRKTAELFQREPYELLGTGWGNHIHPDDLPELVEKYDAAFAAGESASWTDMRIVLPDGTIQWFDSEAIPIVTAAGEPAGYLGVLYGKDGPGGHLSRRPGVVL